MTALTAIPVHPISAPRQAFESVSVTSRQDRHRGTFTELRDLQRQRMHRVRERPRFRRRRARALRVIRDGSAVEDVRTQAIDMTALFAEQERLEA
jgi:hypothetical protein